MPSRRAKAAEAKALENAKREQQLATLAALEKEEGSIPSAQQGDHITLASVSAPVIDRLTGDAAQMQEVVVSMDMAFENEFRNFIVPDAPPNILLRHAENAATSDSERLAAKNGSFVPIRKYPDGTATDEKLDVFARKRAEFYRSKILQAEKKVAKNYKYGFGCGSEANAKALFAKWKKPAAQPKFDMRFVDEVLSRALKLGIPRLQVRLDILYIRKLLTTEAAASIGITPEGTVSTDVKTTVVKGTKLPRNRDRSLDSYLIDKGIHVVLAEVGKRYQYIDNNIAFHASWALTNLASDCCHEDAIMDCGGAETFFQLMESCSAEIVDQAAWGAGNLAGCSWERRDRLLQMGFAKRTAQISFRILCADETNIHSNLEMNLAGLINIVWMAGNLCRSRTNPVRFSDVECMLPSMMIFQGKDEYKQVVHATLWAISFVISTKSRMEKVWEKYGFQLVQSCVKNMQIENKIRSPALRILRDLLDGGDEEQVEIILDAGFLKNLHTSFTFPRKDVKCYACYSLKVIFDKQVDDFTSQVFDHNLVLHLFLAACKAKDDPRLVNHALAAILSCCKACRQIPEYVKILTEQYDALNVLFNAIQQPALTPMAVANALATITILLELQYPAGKTLGFPKNHYAMRVKGNNCPPETLLIRLVHWGSLKRPPASATADGYGIPTCTCCPRVPQLGHVHGGDNTLRSLASQILLKYFPFTLSCLAADGHILLEHLNWGFVPEMDEAQSGEVRKEEKQSPGKYDAAAVAAWDQDVVRKTTGNGVCPLTGVATPDSIESPVVNGVGKIFRDPALLGDGDFRLHPPPEIALGKRDASYVMEAESTDADSSVGSWYSPTIVDPE